MDWIDINKRKPEKADDVSFVFTEEGKIKRFVHFGDEKYFQLFINNKTEDGNDKILFWMPFPNQPERSKREDSDNLGHVFTGIPTTEESWCENCHEEDHVIKQSGMRCSELYGNIERDK